jgi:hypothetical protein
MNHEIIEILDALVEEAALYDNPEDSFGINADVKEAALKVDTDPKIWRHSPTSVVFEWKMGDVTVSVTITKDGPETVMVSCPEEILGLFKCENPSGS